MADIARSQSGQLASAVDRPWLRRREGETALEHRERLSHTCYACGVYMVDMSALDAHEETHR